MAYKQEIADKVRRALRSAQHVEEKKMMGGVTFMVNGKMCVGVIKNDLMCRIDPDIHGDVVGTRGSREMDFTGRPAKGFVFVGEAGTGSKRDFQYWIGLALAYNKRISGQRGSRA